MPRDNLHQALLGKRMERNWDIQTPGIFNAFIVINCMDCVFKCEGWRKGHHNPFNAIMVWYKVPCEQM